MCLPMLQGSQGEMSPWDKVRGAGTCAVTQDITITMMAAFPATASQLQLNVVLSSAPTQHQGRRAQATGCIHVATIPSASLETGLGMTVVRLIIEGAKVPLISLRSAPMLCVALPVSTLGDASSPVIVVTPYGHERNNALLTATGSLMDVPRGCCAKFIWPVMTRKSYLCLGFSTKGANSFNLNIILGIL